MFRVKTRVISLLFESLERSLRLKAISVLKEIAITMLHSHYIDTYIFLCQLFVSISLSIFRTKLNPSLMFLLLQTQQYSAANASACNISKIIQFLHS